MPLTQELDVMDNIKQEIIDNNTVFFIGSGVFYNTKSSEGNQLPHDSNSLSLALNDGRAMSERLMYEYTRTAMTIEQRRGRDYIVQMVKHIYSVDYELPLIYQFIAQHKPKYVIDTNMDDSLQKVYSDTPHTLILGTSRLGAEYDRFLIYTYDVSTKVYVRIDKSEFDINSTILLKPMGSDIPEPSYIVSDADFVDWLTEAMGGYAVPNEIKEYRKDKKYLFIGVDFTKDTFRMVANELTLDLKSGYLVAPKEELSKSEKRFIENHKVEHINIDIDTFMKSIS